MPANDGESPENALQRCMDLIGHSFANPELLRQALTHSSYTADKYLDNERLEFLGDSVIELVVCEDIYSRFPALLEGELTELKGAAVSGDAMADLARDLGLPEFLRLGKGVGNRGELPDSICANVYEAVVAAIHLDGGIDAARRFVLSTMRRMVDEFARGAAGNFKSVLQEHVQKLGQPTPEYRIVGESGPDHYKSFTAAVYLEGEECGQGEGTNKKMAEQAAARSALKKLGLLE